MADELLVTVPDLAKTVGLFLEKTVAHPARFLGATVKINSENKPHVTNDRRSYTLPNECLATARGLFNHASGLDASPEAFGPLQQLHTIGLDREQVWQCLQLRNQPLLDWAQHRLASLKEALEGLEAAEDEDTEQSVSADEDADAAMDDDSQLDSEPAESDEDMDAEEDEDEEEVSDDDLGSDEDGFGEATRKGARDSASARKLRQFAGDSDDDGESDHDDEYGAEQGLNDEFFSLKEMNAFADDAEEAEWRAIEREERGDDAEEDKMSQSEDEDIDYFQDPDEHDFDESENDEEEDMVDAGEIRYADFFLPPQQSKKRAAERLDMRMAPNESANKEEEKTEESEDDDNEEEAAASDTEQGFKIRRSNLFDDEEQEETDGKSTFERRQEKIQERIQELEEESIAKKDWTLLGEAAAKDRPVNSLLEEDLEFDHAGKAVPIITEEVTATLEDMIKLRIIESRFDDVVRKRDPKATPFRPSEQVEMNDEKSKQSLAQIYEDEYVRATADTPVMAAKDEALQKEHGEIDGLWRKLCTQLDAFCNQHYVPKMPKVEVKVVTDVGAIAMEEAIPVTAADASLLAPEEVYEKQRGEVKGVTELDQAERKRLRQRKKRLHKLRHGTTTESTPKKE